MARPRLFEEGFAPRNRKGQIPPPNTLKSEVWRAIPTDRYVKTIDLFMSVAERYPALNFQECKKILCDLKTRELIERVRVKGHQQYQQRRISVKSTLQGTQTLAE